MLVAYAVLVVAALLLVVRERRAANLVMPWSLFKRPRFAGANLVGFLFNLALYGSMFMLSLYLQHARGSSPFRAGLELLPMTIWFPLANIVYSRISARFSNGALLTVFLLVAGIASLTMVTVSSETPYWVLAVAVGLANIGAGIISPGMTAALVDAMRRRAHERGGVRAERQPSDRHPGGHRRDGSGPRHRLGLGQQAGVVLRGGRCRVPRRRRRRLAADRPREHREEAALATA